MDLADYENTMEKYELYIEASHSDKNPKNKAQVLIHCWKGESYQIMKDAGVSVLAKDYATEPLLTN